MAGNARFDSTSASAELEVSGNYLNGQRGSYLGPSLDRSGSSREIVESRNFGSGINTARGSGALTGDLPPLSQCLTLEPITLGEQKYKSGDLKRLLSFPSTSEDTSFGAGHLKPSLPVATEELKRIRASFADSNYKAKSRAKKLDENLHIINKYSEASASKKQQRNEPLTSERSGGSNLKTSTQIHRNTPDITHKLEDRQKNLVLNKRVRTSVAETRPEGRGNGPPRQPLVIAKDRDMQKESGADPDIVEEKIRRLPAGGEGWDKKMKRRRSVGAVFSRPMDNGGELKRAVHQKLGSEPAMQSLEAHSYRSGASNGSLGIAKLDSTSSPAGSSLRLTPKNEQEKAHLPRDHTAGLTRERLLAKGNNKLNNREENHIIPSTLVTKGKASRAPRTGSIMVSSSTSCPRLSATLESSEQPPNVNRIQFIGGANNRKRSIPSGSSSPPMAQWVGQRPPKMSRTRRANLMSPVSNHDDVQISPEGCSPSDYGSRLTSSGTNGSFLSRGVANGTPQFKIKHELVSSPRLSESEESGAGENRLKEKGGNGGELEDKVGTAAQNATPSVMLTKKSKLLAKEELGDRLRRQMRVGRGSSISRASISPTREKSDSAASTKPARSVRPGSDKNGSKTGRPLKKFSDRKGFSRLGHTSNSASPDCTGDSDDDREELFAAASYACNSSYIACSSSFWKKTEPLFASLSLEDASYLLKQLKSVEELNESISRMFDHGKNDLTVHQETSAFHSCHEEKNRFLKNQIGSEEPASAVNLVDQFHDGVALFGRSDSERFEKVTPLYQRVLSALIMEDEFEEFEGNGVDENISFQNATGNSLYGSCLITDDAEPKRRHKMESDCGSVFGVQFRHHDVSNGFFSYNNSPTISRSSSIQNLTCDDKLMEGNGGFMHPEVDVLVEFSGSDRDKPQNMQARYEQMCVDDKLLLELQSIGLYPETVPDLDDGENEVISQEILQLRRGLYQKVCKKKACLEKLDKIIHEQKDAQSRDLQQVAMDRLVELAYKKLLATRGSTASKFGVAKVSKHVAMAFARRTLAKCHKFEASGTSCFSEPVLRDIIFACPPQSNEAELVSHGGLPVTNDKHVESHNSQPKNRASGSFHGSAGGGLIDKFETMNNQHDQVFVKSGQILNRGKKKEVLLDDVVGGINGIKGKRSDRERDNDALARNPVAKAGRSLAVNIKGERKTKTKPKQKAAQLPNSGNGFVSKFAESLHPVYPGASGSELGSNTGNRKREGSQDSLREIKEPMDCTNMQLHELDPIEELGVGTDLTGNPDISSWFNFDEDGLQDGLQDHDAVGLDIPMDDLSELNMF